MPGPPSPQLVFGPFLIGLILSTATYGVMAVQMFQYYQKYRNDNSRIRYFILYLFLANTANLVFEIAIVYEPLIVRYGTQRASIVSPLLLPGDAVSVVAISTPVQMFTAWRIRVITGSIVLPLIISFLSVASFAGGLGVTIFVSIRNEFHQFQSFSSVIIVWLVASAVCDVLITIVLTYSLTTRKTGFSAVDGQINRIIRLTVQTGAITAVAALADLILFLVFPTTSLNFIPDFPLSKLYTISLLSTLNARTRGRSEDVDERLPNALFNDSTAQKSITTATHNSMLPSRRHENVHIYPNSYQSPKSMLVGSGERSFVVQTMGDEEDQKRSDSHSIYPPSHSHEARPI
ncbi:hypothetical protein R3P38DRAFT_519337 [Favolaschia claudopus]|uniref:DUF6534 domain-containing protein n=1 Tax=Favolaschia claudopus TaxID=2862362 RepID=A0AAV9ZD57_9AGAR